MIRKVLSVYCHRRARRWRSPAASRHPRPPSPTRHDAVRRRRRGRRLDAEGHDAWRSSRRQAARRSRIPLTLTASKSTGKYAERAAVVSVPGAQRHHVVYDSGVIGGVGSGNNVTIPCRARRCSPTRTTPGACARPARAPSARGRLTASFKSPIGAFIRGNEVRDPLTIGRTVGEIRGPVQFNAERPEAPRAREPRALPRCQQTLQARRVLDDDPRRRRRLAKGTRARSSRCRKAPTRATSPTTTTA